MLEHAEKKMLETYAKALRHYSKRLTKLQDDEEILEQGNGEIQRDIKESSAKALEISQEFDQYNSGHTLMDYLPLIKCALAFYKKDLKESMKMLEKKMGIKIPTRHTLDEIKFIDKIFYDMNWDEPTLDTEKI